MYRRLITFGVSVCAVALTALLIPLVLGSRDVVQITELGEAATTARLAASAWEREPAGAPPPSVATDGSTVTWFVAAGTTLGGPPAPGSEPLVAAARGGTASAAVLDGWGAAASPALLAEGTTGVVLVSVTPAQMRQDWWPRLAAIGGVSLFLLGCAAVASWQLARRTVAPLTALAATAEQVADGDLTARAQPSPVREIDDVGRALNRVTGRVQELLAEQRLETAELAHQLRTPLTVLRIDIDGVADPAAADRLRDDVDAVQRMVDEIITTARRPLREGLVASCDAVAVVGGRVRFWQVLAEDQGRRCDVVLPPGPVAVRLTAEDLATAVDILLQNVFVHTPEGIALRITVSAAADVVRVTVADEGPGLGASAPVGSGSTGLGLSIADRLAVASGGQLEMAGAAGSGTSATLILGRAQQ